jgi:four helix bundle protein
MGEGSGYTARYEALRRRMKDFALRIVRLSGALPKGDEGQVIGKQILKSGTSVGANYRAVCRARSRAEFASKMGIVLEEANETVFWLEVIVEAKLLPAPKVQAILTEAEELTRIFAASFYTARCPAA